MWGSRLPDEHGLSVAIEEEAGSIEAEWTALWQRCAGATPFQHPAWLLPWWAAFGTGRALVAVARIAGQVVGVLPAYVLPASPLEEAGAAKLLPIGAGTSDYLDALGEGAAPMLGALLARAAAEGVGRCDLMEVPPGSALSGVHVSGWAGVWSEGSACPVLRLGQEPAGILRKLRMNRNRAARAGGWTMEDAGPAGLATLVALHQARWEAVGEAGVLRDPAVLRMLEVALPRLAEAGLLRLQVLHVGGQTAAAVLALLAPGRVFFYASGYDAAQAFVSPGTLLVGAMLEQARGEGRAEAHFLRGREAYKYAWGAIDRMNQAGAYRLGRLAPSPSA